MIIYFKVTNVIHKKKSRIKFAFGIPCDVHQHGLVTLLFNLTPSTLR